MSIIGALPVTLSNGTTADATQVMTDFNWIVSQTNANGAALAGGNAFTGPQTIGGDVITTNTALQTLTNKTLTAPTINSPVFGGTGTGTLTQGGNGVVVPGAYVPQVATTATMIGAGNIAWVLASAPLDQKYNDVVLAASTISFRFVNDAVNFAVPWLTVTRSGTTVTDVNIGNNTFHVSGSSDGRVYGTALHNNPNPVTGTANQYLASGTYTPSLTNASNISSSSNGGPANYTRVGNVVTVSGSVTLTTTVGAGAGTELRMSLPIPSTFTQVSNIAGVGASASGGANGPTSQIGVNLGAPTVASMQFFAANAASHGFQYQYTYVIM